MEQYQLTNSHSEDKQNSPRHPVATTAVILACISLVFLAINLRGTGRLIFAEGKIAAAILQAEAGLCPETQLSLPNETGTSSPEITTAVETSTSEQTAPATTAPVFPPAAANSHATNQTIPQAEPNAAENVITTTVTGEPGRDYLQCGDIYIKNNTRYSPDLEALLSEPWDTEPSPTVLIVHTHATECYNPTELDSYTVETGDRCTDPEYSVVRVGAELASELRSRGIRVIHDKTLFDAESYTGAYAKSNAAVKTWLDRDPSIAVVLDIHRDALNVEGATRYRLAVESQLGDAAQMLILVGTDAADANHPDWQKNLSLALKIQQGLISATPNIARPMLLTNSSYDQETTHGSLLVEIGTNGNSLADAIVSARLLGRTLADILG